MGPKLFLIAAAALAGALGTAITSGLIPTEYAGLVAGIVTFLGTIVRPPVQK